jgi:formiminotetrahydrofolate cyclodeaminase
VGAKGLAGNPLTELLERIAADTPAPGGGPAAAWSCALAAALVEMVSAVELRRQATAAATERAQRAKALRGRALELAELDVVAYTRVLEVERRRDEPGHGGRMRAALSDAAEPPVELARVAAEVTELAADAATGARGGVRGEAVAAAVLAAAAVRATTTLAEINLGGAPGDRRLAELARLDGITAAALRRADP